MKGGPNLQNDYGGKSKWGEEEVTEILSSKKQKKKGPEREREGKFAARGSKVEQIEA